MINIGNRRECFFDYYLIDTQKTTARLMLHSPVKRERVMLHDLDWEGDDCGSHTFFFDDRWYGCDGEFAKGTYRMYYRVHRTAAYDPSPSRSEDIAICYAESPDGINWVRPDLGLYEWNGNIHTNIVLDKTIHDDLCTCYVFRDPNPDCPPDEKYKLISAYDEPKKPNGEKGKFRLFCYPSSDGIHFRPGYMLTDKGYFDSVNVIVWDDDAGLYRGFVRGVHCSGFNPADGFIGSDDWDTVVGQIKAGSGRLIRDVMYIESKDFHVWTDPVWLRYDDGDEIQMYNNNVMPYFRAPHQYIGFPLRYFERTEWTPNYDELRGSEKRRERCKEQKRFGLAITDCGFMTSRDCVHFHRFPNAFVRPSAENGRNWVYGDGEIAYGMLITGSSDRGAEDELSLYFAENRITGEAMELYRHTIRIDGFASLHADGEETVVTKPFVYNGSRLSVNISTSAFGYLYFTLIDKDGSWYVSSEVFGDSTDRSVFFDGDIIKRLSGCEVTLEVRMRDADLYSMIFS
nr:hypothetical protein [Clostridia bacterium]